jgi:hypothetical protein
MSILSGTGDPAQGSAVDPFALPATLELVNVLGMRVSVACDGASVFAAMRAYGAAGFAPGPVPPGGIRLPYAMRDRFDWRLIGARTYTFKDDDGTDAVMVEHLGETYRRRDFEANPRKKMPAATKFSRGAHPGDDPAIVEKGSGEDTYVTLALFRGGGPVIEHLCVPTAPQETREERARAEAEAARQRESARQLREGVVTPDTVAAHNGREPLQAPPADGPVQHATHAEVAGLFRQLGIVDTPAKVRWAQDTLGLDLRGKLTPEQVDAVRDRLEGALAVKAERERLAAR